MAGRCRASRSRHPEYVVIGGDGGESNSPSRELPAGMCYRLVRRLLLALRVSCRPEFPGSQPVVLGPRYRRCAGCTSTYGAHSLPSRRGEGGRGSRVRPPELLAFRQLLFCRLVDGADGAPACNSARPPPVETTRPHVMIQRIHYITRGLWAWGVGAIFRCPWIAAFAAMTVQGADAFHHCHSERSGAPA